MTLSKDNYTITPTPRLCQIPKNSRITPNAHISGIAHDKQRTANSNTKRKSSKSYDIP